MKQCPIDFFDPEVQHLAASAGCRLYRMQNDTGEGLISEYPILSGINLFYNDFHMKDGQNHNKRPCRIPSKSITAGKGGLSANFRTAIISKSVRATCPFTG